MHIHILGICGTFMGGIALLAKHKGHKVTGQDLNVYPPMSTQLEQQGINLTQGYGTEALLDEPDMIVIGNALSRGNSAVEYVLNHNLPYTSGAQWLADHILKDCWVLAVAGTHGKTTTASMLAWILEYAGLAPGFLIGGVPENFGVSSRAGDTPFFVVEADEYDTAFFDKRSKFVHYHPRTAIINNIEFDHADIFNDLDAIKTQFHHLIRTIPSEGLIIYPDNDENIQAVLAQGNWSQTEQFSLNNSDINSQLTWRCELLPNSNGALDGSRFKVICNNKAVGEVNWQLIGEHNVSNALAAIAAARHSGIPVHHAIDALGEFKNVKRRMEIKEIVNNITIYDDFAHHPTAIATTIDGLRKKVANERIFAILEPRSNTMKMQVHNQNLPQSLQQADKIFIYLPAGYENKFDNLLNALADKMEAFSQINELVDSVVTQSLPHDHLLVMSNGGFEGIHDQLIMGLKNKR